MTLLIETRLPTLQAVRCKVCGTLHPVDSGTYIVLTGMLSRRENVGGGRWIERTEGLGSDANPTVVCDDRACILAVIKTGDSES